MLREIDRSAERTELPEELRAALAKRKASQALIHKTMAEYLDQILAERVCIALPSLASFCLRTALCATCLTFSLYPPRIDVPSWIA